MNFMNFLKGLAAVAIGGAATGAAQALNAGQIGKSTLVTAGVGSLTTVIAYILKSPFIQQQSSAPSEQAQKATNQQ